ncbi:MAG TPA: GFA family protein [Pseudolabrys sp.]|nr:GFA family protein [Pseudolabrys sp.]
MKVDGACHCGRITFEAEADPEAAYICHCTDCQTLSGSAFRVVVPSQKGSFKIRTGEPRIYVKTAESGNRREQAFCPDCGSPIYSSSADDGPKFYSLRVPTIRQRDRFIPKKQIWFRSSLDWLFGLEAAQKIEKQQPT